MKFGLLGYYPEYNHNDMEVVDFSSNKTILEYDVLIVGLNNIFVEYRHNSEYNGFPRITDHDSMQLKRDLERRKNEIKEFLESGKSIIIINGNDECVYCYTGNKTVSGTGRNAQTTYIVHDVHSSSLLPVKMSSMNLSGNAVSIVNKNISETFKKYSDYIEYKTAYENVDDKKVLMTIRGTKKVVSYFEEIGNGLLIYAPDLLLDRNNYNRESTLERKYFNDLTNLKSELSQKDVELPEYSKKYLLNREELMIDAIEKSKEKLKKLMNELEIKEKELKNLQKHKIMFAGNGTALEINSVEDFKEIGFSIIKYDPKSVDEDIVIKYKEKTAVVEVKGVSGSATEKHTSQVVKWKSEYHIENDIMPKGILLINAFKDKELDKRQEYFPNQMLKYAAHQEICLLTTIQLYNIKEYLKENPNDKDRIITEVFETNGRFQGFEDWKMNIKM